MITYTESVVLVVQEILVYRLHSSTVGIEVSFVT
ncbi:Bgt-50466 [Blumeria graminis f. sp. tritici]|uniref:Bgt-50466 n=1 Tax=Blumeria graminis f. sp. tritici TaxID=62690 RepID=A0A9X9L870_BLUGR|nr:Bgt-50466 [Blumeria graminis f. sp. tritici]